MINTLPQLDQLKMDTAKRVNQSKTNKSKRKPREEWRRYGAARRKELVAKDEVEGGTSFEMYKKCPIERYFRIAEKAMGDFQAKCRDPNCNMEEAYIMGHRLKAFLGKALPQHPNYRKLQIAQLRSKSLRQLEWIKEEMEDIALKIDEDYLNTYITMDFEPSLDEFSSSSEDDESGFADFSSCSIEDLDDTEWHDFTGWTVSAFSDNSQTQVPLATETDSSRSRVSSSQEVSDSDDESSDSQTPIFDPDGDLDDDEQTTEDVDEPKTIVTFQDDADNESSESDLDNGPSEFFRRIQNETVCYESDSEAVDSWAQDGESHARSCASSGTALTYDPARIAFREIMSNVPRDRNQLCWQNGCNANLNPARYLPPKNSSPKKGEAEKGDSWAPFNVVAVRQKRNRLLMRKHR